MESQRFKLTVNHFVLYKSVCVRVYFTCCKWPACSPKAIHHMLHRRPTVPVLFVMVKMWVCVWHFQFTTGPKILKRQHAQVFSSCVHPLENHTRVLTLYVLFLRTPPVNLEHRCGPHTFVLHSIMHYTLGRLQSSAAMLPVASHLFFGAIILTVAIAKISGWGCVMWQDSHACENSSREFHLPVRWL